jgi:hypothetical protein
MANLQSLKTDFLISLNEPADTTRFTPSQQTGFLNQGMRFIATLSNANTDLVKVTTTENIGAYTFPADGLLINEAYYGNELVASDTYPLEIITKKYLKEIAPEWLDETSGASGKPRYLLKIDRQTVYIHPRPDAASAGKKIFLDYGYMPVAMSQDSDEPDLPLVFHDIIVLYALSRAYDSLSKPEMAAKKFNDFKSQYNLLKDIADREAEDTFRWKWLVE